MGGNKGRDIRPYLRKKSRAKRRRAPGKDAAAAAAGRVNPRRITLADLERGLRKAPAGEDLTIADLEADLEAGFQPNADGTIDLVRYVAWLLRRHGYGRAAG